MTGTLEVEATVIQKMVQRNGIARATTHIAAIDRRRPELNGPSAAPVTRPGCTVGNRRATNKPGCAVGDGRATNKPGCRVGNRRANAKMRGSATQDGFEVLETLDTNHDGKIVSFPAPLRHDAIDADFASPRVWQDANEDGVNNQGARRC
ncbi:MAG: hypothetical protein R3D68_05275 [Hyphomicrobiaceae bacterium]